MTKFSTKYIILIILLFCFFIFRLIMLRSGVFNFSDEELARGTSGTLP